MVGSIRDDDGPDPLDGTEGAVGAGDHTLFVEDLRTAFPETRLPQRVAEDHFAAMVGAIQLLADKGDSALEPTSNAQGPDRRVSGLPKLRRRTMPKRLIAKLAVAMAMLLSLAGLANAGMLPDPIQEPIANVLGFDTDDADDQGEDANVFGDEVEHGGLVGADPDADDQGEDADDQGEDADDQGEDTDDRGEDADDRGEDADDQGEDADDQADDDDQGEDADDQADDDQADDSQSEDDDQGDGDSDQ